MIVAIAALALAALLAVNQRWIGAAFALACALIVFASMVAPTPCNLAELVNGRWIAQLFAYGTAAPGCLT
jgi:hypothetical protein